MCMHVCMCLAPIHTHATLGISAWIFVNMQTYYDVHDGVYTPWYTQTCTQSMAQSNLYGNICLTLINLPIKSYIKYHVKYTCTPYTYRRAYRLWHGQCAVVLCRHICVAKFDRFLYGYVYVFMLRHVSRFECFGSMIGNQTMQ